MDSSAHLQGTASTGSVILSAEGLCKLYGGNTAQALAMLHAGGDCADIRGFAATVLAERGVRHGRLNLVPVATEAAAHSHGAGKVHSHLHLKVKDAF